MSKKSTDAANLKLNESDMKILEDALDILVRKELSEKKSIESNRKHMRSSTTKIQGYFGDKIDAQIAILEMSLSYGHPITLELNEEKGCGSACKTSCVSSCSGACKGGCKTGLVWF